MAAILGFHHPPDAPPRSFEPRWHRASRALASRCPSNPLELRTRTTRLHFRGKAPDSLLDGSSISVCIDGQVDNLLELADRHSGEVRGKSAARCVRDLYLCLGTKMFEVLEGDFTLAVVDHGSSRVHLVRDRFGTKSLFFAMECGSIMWASELKGLLPLLEHPALDERGLAEVLHYRWLAGDRSLVQGVRQVMPGTFVTLGEGISSDVRKYWSIDWNPSAPTEPPEAWVEQTREAMDGYLSAQLSVSTRVGVFLSGGVDSSLLAAFTAGHSTDCVLITPIWESHPDPELPRARLRAKHLGLEHRVLPIEDDFVESAFPDLIWRLEQPPRHYNSFAWAALAEGLGDLDTVVYGEAAGTMFGSQVGSLVMAMERQRRLPSVVRKGLAPFARVVPTRTRRSMNLRQLLEEDERTMVLRLGRLPVPGRLAHRVKHVPRWQDPNEKLVDLHFSGVEGLEESVQQVRMYTLVASSMYKMDRFFTPTGIRILTPFLAPWLNAVGARLPTEYKVRDGHWKPILRDLGEAFYPRPWMYEPKLGFPTPKVPWLDGPLRLRVQRLMRGETPSAGVFGPAAVRSLRMPIDHEAIWTLLGLDEFIERFLGGDSRAAVS